MNNSDQINEEVKNTAIDPVKVGGTYKAIRLLLKEGLTFDFDDEEDKIKFHASGLSGMETVYFNDEEVSKSRHINFSSRHIFQKKGHDYEINIIVKSVLRGELECSVMKDGQLIGRKVQIKGVEVSKKTVFIFLLKAFAIGFIAGSAIAFIIDKLF